MRTSVNKVRELVICSSFVERYIHQILAQIPSSFGQPDGVDYALSFQDPEGCMELWNFILEVQSLRADSGGASSVSDPDSFFFFLNPNLYTHVLRRYRGGHVLSMHYA